MCWSGGHLDVVQLLVSHKADIDGQDNRRVSSLMAAFRKGHVKVVKWLVQHVTQFPSDQECARYITSVSDKVKPILIVCNSSILRFTSVLPRAKLSSHPFLKSILLRNYGRFFTNNAPVIYTIFVCCC